MLLLRKGVYAYEYMDSMDKFNEKELPTIGKFYSSLNNSNISKDDYNHAKKVWDLFEVTQQTFVGLQDVLKTSSARRLGRPKIVTVKTS